MTRSIFPIIVISLGLSCSQTAELPPTAPDQGSSSLGERLIIEFVHSTVSIEACSPFERGEVCREFSHWLIRINDQLYRDWDEAKRLLQSEARKSIGFDPINKEISALRVSIRARKEVPYPLPQKAMNMCAAAGVYNITVAGAPR